MPLKPGTIVKVFQKPLTDEQFEGCAVVEKQVHEDPELPMYQVRFADDPKWTPDSQRPRFFEEGTFIRTVLDRHVA